MAVEKESVVEIEAAQGVYQTRDVLGPFVLPQEHHQAGVRVVLQAAQAVEAVQEVQVAQEILELQLAQILLQDHVVV